MLNVETRTALQQRRTEPTRRTSPGDWNQSSHGQTHFPSRVWPARALSELNESDCGRAVPGAAPVE
jgi:hypothetical protein